MSASTTSRAGAGISKFATTVSETQEKGNHVRDISGDVIDDGLRRGLKGCRFIIIALGGIIGPGCFYGLGYGIQEAEPLGLLIGFFICGSVIYETDCCISIQAHQVIGASIWILMQSVGEVAALFPIHGGFVEVWETQN
jgi:amino acid transporter